MSPAVRMPLAIIFSMVLAAIFETGVYWIAGDRYALMMGPIVGISLGLMPVGLVMMTVVARVRFMPAMLWCFGVGGLAGALGFVLMGDRYAGMFALVGLCLTACVLYLFGPPYRVYRYGRCPGCDYNLVSLPKRDVCPECGRDNRDLVEMFADVDARPTGEA